MKNFIIYLSVIMISNIYAECDDYGQSQCSNDNNCEWVDNIETEYCDGENAAECLTQDECSWDLTYGGYLSFEWYYSCNGYYEIDNSYCQEIVMPECSEMDEFQCSHNFDCDWVEDIQIGNCSDITNSSECYQTNQCSWYNAGSYGYWYDNCYGGTYEITNSYCEEVSNDAQLGDLNDDYIINIQDVIIVVNLVLNLEYNYLADINGDLSVNVLDIIELVNTIMSAN